MTRLVDLAVGKIFSGKELIVEIDEKAMRTVRNEIGKAYGQECNVMSYMYNLKFDINGADAILNEWCEIFSDDEMHPLYLKQLKDARIWKEE